MAEGGTVFLDEIGEMVPALQAKLLRFLEERTFKRVGGVSDVRVDVRVISATNRNLQEEVRQGKFREDLFYRLNVLPIALPPLRDRADDIARLVTFYIDAYNIEFKKRIRGVTPEAMQQLQRYPWPGNVRELRNAVERAMLLAEGDTLTANDLSGTAAGPVRLSDRVELPPWPRKRRIFCGCRPPASISSNSNDRCSCRRSSGPDGTRRTPPPSWD